MSRVEDFYCGCTASTKKLAIAPVKGVEDVGFIVAAANRFYIVSSSHNK